jgi:hypothetical protein
VSKAKRAERDFWDGRLPHELVFQKQISIRENLDRVVRLVRKTSVLLHRKTFVRPVLLSRTYSFKVFLEKRHPSLHGPVFRVQYVL